MAIRHQFQQAILVADLRGADECQARQSPILPELNDATIEYGTDTTRAIGKLLFTGSAGRFPDIRFIFSHAGGTLDRKSTRLNSSHSQQSRMPSSA